MEGIRPKLLVVEDDTIMGMEMKEILESFGYDVIDVCDQAEKAVISAQRAGPDAVLMDIRLKGDTDGIEAAERMRVFSAVPIVFLTGYKDNATVERAAKIMNSLYLTKPVDFDDLRLKLSGFLSKKV